MTDWAPFVLVPYCEVAKRLPLSSLVLQEDLTLTRDGQPIDVDAAFALIAVAVSTTKAGAALLDAFEAALLPSGRSLKDLRCEGKDAMACVAQGLAQALVRSQGRVARQMREIGQIRQLTERSLQSFERLEAFVWQSAKAERNAVLHLAPQASFAPQAMEQRLPCDSAGLSDIALHVSTPGTGRLRLALQLMESAETVAQWTITDPQAGWLRLALPRALGPDAQTPVLRIDWEGEGLEIGLSLAHPDCRFQARDGSVLALRLWKFIPGTMAPLSPESLAPDDMPARGRWLIGLAAMAEAAGRAADPRIEMVDWAGGLVMRPGMGESLSICLPGMVRPGMARLQGHVVLEGADMVAEVAYALSAPGGEPEAVDWQILTTEEPGQIHHLTQASESVRDLWLCVRMPADEAGVVIFERIEGFAEVTGRDD